MLRPSFTEMIDAVNKYADEGSPEITSRYSIVIAAAKRARQLIAGAEPLIDDCEGKKPLSIAVEEIYQGKVKILSEDDKVEDNEY
nr:DNA-directed RNA polymerase subunit omega [Clostridium vitabionis]